MRHRASSSIHDEATLGKAYDARLMRRLWGYVKPHRGLVVASLALMLTVSAVQLLQPYLIKLAIDDHIASGRLEGLGRLALLFLAALVAEFGLRFGQLYVLQRTGQNVVFDVRMAVFAHLQHLSSSFFDRNPVGRLMTRLTTDVEALLAPGPGHVRHLAADAAAHLVLP
jgi:ATP-binding cassette subfamily B protein